MKEEDVVQIGINGLCVGAVTEGPPEVIGTTPDNREIFLRSMKNIGQTITYKGKPFIVMLQFYLNQHGRTKIKIDSQVMLIATPKAAAILAVH